MKKLLLILSLVCISFTAFAADLNPFAYGLRSSVNASNPMQLDIWFSINAPATSVKVYLYEIDGDWEVEVDAHLMVDNRAYEGWIDLSVVPGDLRGGTKNLNWRVDVTGAAVASPIAMDNSNRKLYSPTSIDIDNNPQNENFGTVFVVEGLPNAKDNATYSSYLSYNDGAGLYLFNADGTARPMPNRPAGKYGYNGGRVQQTRDYFNGSSSGGYSPYRVRVSDDGRIFISSMTTDGEVLWEADPLVFSRPDAADWETRAVAGWSHVMSAKNTNTVLGTGKRNCSHTYCGIYHLYQGNAGGPFIAGPNMGFDVRGSGGDLKLLMLAGCKDAIVKFTKDHYYCDEYDLGTDTVWNTPPSRRIFSGYVVNYAGVQVQYDGDGNVWLCQHRSGTDAETLMKFDVNNLEADPWKETPKKPYHRCGAIRFNNDYTQVAIATVGSGSGGAFTVYPVVDGMPVWKQGTQVDTYSETSYSHMDYAWDYAGNLYIAADAANGSKGRCVAIYAMPHAADRVVSTPAASRYAFTVSCQAGKQYTVTTICNPSEAGIINCSVGGNTRAAGVMTLESCTELTVTATPEVGYKFINWTDGNDNVLSTNNEFTFYVTEDITLKANFEYATYTGIVWKSLFLDDQDIADESATHPGTNERLWRLFQVEYNNYSLTLSKGSQGDAGSKTVSGVDMFAAWSFFMQGNNSLYSPSNNKAPTNGTIFTDILEPFMEGSEGTSSNFKWLGQYLETLAGKEIDNTNSTSGNYWGYFLQSFVNRISTFKNYALETDVNLNSYDCPDFTIYGQPNKWRPCWTESVCQLPMTMKYSDYMPILDTWTRPDSPAGSIKELNKSTITPSSWYKWNEPHETLNPLVCDVPYEKYFILAWRNGGPTKPEIVHHVYESNMELHASYVLKNIDEEDRVNPNANDASNDDVIQLMQNRRYVDLNEDLSVVPTHTLTVTRKLQAGMFNTICLPFGVDLTTLQDDQNYSHPLRDAEAYEFAGTTASTYDESGDPVTILNFNKVTQLQAGKPYLVKLKEGKGDVIGDMTFSSVSCNTTLTPSVGGGLIFQPTINPTEVPAGSLILVANDRLALTTSAGEMKGMRGYFMIDPSNPLLADDIAEQAKDGRVYLSFKKPTTTSLPMAPEAEQQTKPQIRKIMYDGKIYILRGDEVYTITGHRVK